MKAVAGFLVAILVAGALAWFVVLPNFFSARADPSKVEAWAVRGVRRLAIPRAIRDRANPIGLSSEVLADGRSHFADHCAICHANDGREETEMGPKFYPPVPDLTSKEIQSLSDGEIYYAIRNGVRFTGMPAWGSDETEDEWSNWTLVHFVRHLPKITKQELREMEKLNPKTAEEVEEQRFLHGGEETGSRTHRH